MRVLQPVSKRLPHLTLLHHLHIQALILRTAHAAHHLRLHWPATKAKRLVCVKVNALCLIDETNKLLNLALHLLRSGLHIGLCQIILIDLQRLSAH